MSGESKPVNSNHNRRVDVHEVEIKNINHAITRMESAIEKQSESMIQLSESMAKIAAQQELVTSISIDTRSNSDRLYKTEERISLLENKTQNITQVKDDINALEKKQTKSTVYIGIGVFVATVLGAAALNHLFTLFLS